jgi:hypothetical protein
LGAVVKSLVDHAEAKGSARLLFCDVPSNWVFTLFRKHLILQSIDIDMDFGRYNQAEQAQIAQMIEHKQVNTSC